MSAAPQPRRRRRPARSLPPQPATSLDWRIDATLLDRAAPLWTSKDKLQLASHLFELISDYSDPHSVPLKPMGIRLRDDVRDWLLENEIGYGAHTDLNPTENWFSIDTYLIIPNPYYRDLFVLRWGRA